MTTVHLKDDRQSQKDIDIALRKLKKKVAEAGFLKTLQDKAQYERPGIKRNKKRAAAIMRWKREQDKNKLPEKLY